MPKTKKKSDKDSEEFLKELAESLNKEQKKDADNNLEHDDFSGVDFNQFMSSGVDAENAPVLERIAGQQAANPRFFSTTRQGETNPLSESDEFKYISSSEQGNEPKYIASSEAITSRPEAVDMGKIGRNVFEKTRNLPEIFRQSSEAGFGQGDWAREKTWGAERLDVENTGRKNPFEKDEIKYEKYNPKMPK